MVGALVAILILVFIGWVIYELARRSTPPAKPRATSRPEPSTTASDDVWADDAGDLAGQVLGTAIESSARDEHHVPDGGSTSTDFGSVAEASDSSSFLAEHSSSDSGGGWSLFGSDDDD